MVHRGKNPLPRILIAGRRGLNQRGDNNVAKHSPEGSHGSCKLGL